MKTWENVEDIIQNKSFESVVDLVTYLMSADCEFEKPKVDDFCLIGENLDNYRSFEIFCFIDNFINRIQDRPIKKRYLFVRNFCFDGKGEIVPTKREILSIESLEKETTGDSIEIGYLNKKINMFMHTILDGHVLFESLKKHSILERFSNSEIEEIFSSLNNDIGKAENKIDPVVFYNALSFDTKTIWSLETNKWEIINFVNSLLHYQQNPLAFFEKKH